MALDHFSHDHPLTLINEARKEDGEEKVVCYGCQKPILGSAYSCSKCNYFLHEKCAELPKEITHPKHLEHPLTLLSHPPYRSASCSCNVCRIGDWRWFTYHCSLCQFDLHVTCAMEEGAVEHESHQHPLTVMHTEASFHCDACGTKEEDFSYLCSPCKFWIHKSCALSPSTFKHGDHDHPLVLNYYLPYKNRTFKYYCDVCKEIVHRTYWVYSCDRCRYFAHIKCVTSEPTSAVTSDQTTAEQPFDPNIINFPINGEPTDLLAELLNKVNLADNERAMELAHFSHDHQLSLFDVQGNNNQMNNNEEMICRGCVRPIISLPFYGCIQCNFFLHKCCIEIPQELQHPCHPEHPLNLTMSSNFLNFSKCEGCDLYTNGFAYSCKSCKFQLDIVCALLPVKIKHEAHKHPLQVSSTDSSRTCNACNLNFEGFMYGCDTCNFLVDYPCAMLPRTVKHDWDRHRITLRYPPYSDHPDEFYCDLCEEEIHPKFWLYHCRDCDQSFHTECLRPYSTGLSNIMFGGTLEVDIHPHLLTFVNKLKNKKSNLCQRCSEDLEVPLFLSVLHVIFNYVLPVLSEFLNSLLSCISDSKFYMFDLIYSGFYSRVCTSLKMSH